MNIITEGFAERVAVAEALETIEAKAQAMDELLAMTDQPSERLQILSSLLIYKEIALRKSHGLAPYHGESMDDLLFRFCTADFNEWMRLALQGSRSQQFLAKFCAGEQVIGIHRPHELKPLPDVEQMPGPDFSDQNIIYLACDAPYFRNFCIPLLNSIRHAQVHVHLMLCHGESVPVISSPMVRMSFEYAVKPTPEYFHAIRFIRFAETLRAYGKTLWLMDVDALFNSAPSYLFEAVGDSDCAFRIRPARFEPWNQFSAAIVGAKPSSQAYFDSIADIIHRAYSMGALHWQIDQMAMLLAFQNMKDEGNSPSVSFLGELIQDLEYRENGVVWCAAGRGKYDVFRHVENESARQMRYRRKFNYYRLGG